MSGMNLSDTNKSILGKGGVQQENIVEFFLPTKSSKVLQIVIFVQKLKKISKKLQLERNIHT